MDILLFFKNIRSERKELISMLLHKEDVRLSLLPRAIDYSKDKVQSTPGDPMISMMERLEKIEVQEKMCQDKILADIQTANDIINAMPTAEYRTIIRLRYIDGDRPMHWQDIALEMDRDPVDLRGRMHGLAIAEAREAAKKLHGTTN